MLLYGDCTDRVGQLGTGREKGALFILAFSQKALEALVGVTSGSAANQKFRFKRLWDWIPRRLDFNKQNLKLYLHN